MKSIIKFPMNITAGHLYKSHKGSNALDLNNSTIIYAPFDCKVAKIYGKGSTNSVWFESIEKVQTPLGLYHVTFRCAHMNTSKFNDLGIKLGKIFEQFEICYFAGLGGTSAKHVHIEFGLGKMKGSGWLNTGYTAFNLPVKKIDTDFGTRPMHECVYLQKEIRVGTCDDYQKKYLWKWEEENGKMEFKNGYQKEVYLGQDIHIYKQSKDELISMISLPYGQVADITKFDLPGYEITCIMNTNYFEFGTGKNNGFLGRCQSLTEDARTPGPSDSGFKGYNGTADKHFIDWVICNDGTVQAGDFNSWDYPKSEVLLGAAPAGIHMLHGKDVDKYSPACGYGKVTTPNTQSLIVKNSDGSFAFISVSGRLNLLQCRDFVKQYGCTEMSAHDSGGSTQMIIAGEKKVYTGRKIPVCAIFYKRTSVPVPAPEDPRDLKIVELEKEVAVLNKKIIELEMKIKNAKEALV